MILEILTIFLYLLSGIICAGLYGEQNKPVSILTNMVIILFWFPIAIFCFCLLILKLI
jgi:hypothetical protein